MNKLLTLDLNLSSFDSSIENIKSLGEFFQSTDDIILLSQAVLRIEDEQIKFSGYVVNQPARVFEKMSNYYNFSKIDNKNIRERYSYVVIRYDGETLVSS